VRKAAKKTRRIPKGREHPFGRQFDEQRTKEGRGDMAVFLDNLTNIKVEAGSTHSDQLLRIATDPDNPHSKQFKIKRLHPSLNEAKSLRGVTYSKNLSLVIQGILLNYPELRWWVEEDGLVVDKVAPNLDFLSHFVRIVGPLSVELLQNGELSLESVISIASELDSKGVKLKNHLPLKQWEEIVSHNRKRTGHPIQSFSAAVKHPKFVTFVRRSICRARDRYKLALSLQT
jgi:hypothetical protein